MKNFNKSFGIIALIAIIGLAMTACDDGNDKNGGSPDDLYSVRITVVGSGDSTLPEIVAPNTELEAVCYANGGYIYTGAVSYQWKKNGTAVNGATDKKYTPNEEGNYTVTAAAQGRAVTSDIPLPVAPAFSHFIGTWVGTVDGFATTLKIISSSSAEWHDSGTLSWTLTVSKVEPWLNTGHGNIIEYPSGYLLTGRSVSNLGFPDAEGVELGFFINAAKNKIFCRGGFFNRQG